MPSIAAAVLEIKQLDELARCDSPIHRLDARAKVLVAIIFCGTVMSFGTHDLSALLPFFIFPAVMIARSNLPPLFILKKMAFLCPFVFIVALFNPALDRTIVVHLGSVGISGGWMSFFSIVVRFFLTAGTALVLVGVTGFVAICQALEQMGVPQVFAAQLLFLYRYIFVLAEEGKRMSSARELRAYGSAGLGIASFSPMIGYLLLRTWSRAERIHMAMRARGFDGAFQAPATSHFGKAEMMHLIGWTMLFAFMRAENMSRLLGTLILGSLS